MTIAIERPGLVVHQGDALAVLRTLGSESVHCCVCSPPYMGLRKYLSPGDPDAALEVGQEATPAAFVSRLVEIFRELRRVLRSDGTAWINIGDGYAGGVKGSGGISHSPHFHAAVGYSPNTDGTVKGQRFVGAAQQYGVPAKNLLLVPERLAIALSDDGWIVRSVIIWSKGSCMPESVRDRPTTSHEYILMLAKSERYYFDAQAIAEPVAKGSAGSSFTEGKTGVAGLGRVSERPRIDASTRNSRTVWEINSQPFSAARLGVVGAEHYASYPPELVRRVLACSTSDKGCCAACLAPWSRVVERTALVVKEETTHRTKMAVLNERDATKRQFSGGFADAIHATTGWAPTCACNDPRPPVPATVLDPFAGSGTTLATANKMGRSAIGIELNGSYLPIIAARNAQAGIDFWEGDAS